MKWNSMKINDYFIEFAGILHGHGMNHSKLSVRLHEVADHHAGEVGRGEWMGRQEWDSHE